MSSTKWIALNSQFESYFLQTLQTSKWVTVDNVFVTFLCILFFLPGTGPGATAEINNDKIEILIYHYFAVMWQACVQPLSDQPERMTS